MRIRSIKPEFWSNEKLSGLPPETHMLAAALLNWADDEGYFNANPKLIEGAIFPVRELSGTVPVMLQELSTGGGIGYLEVRIASDRRAYGCILNFKDHQVVNHPRESDIRPLFEACSAAYVNTTGQLPEPSVNIPTGNGKEGKGKEGKGTGKDRRGRLGGFVPDEQAEPIRQRMLNVNRLTSRQAATRWSAKELEAFKAAGLDKCSADDFAEQIAPLQAYYAAALAELRPHWGTKGTEDFRRRDLVTILSNWGGEVDRATKYCEFARKKDEEEKRGRL